MQEATQTLSFGLLLKRYRRAAGLTQEMLAERAGYSTTYLSKLERGERIPLTFTLSALAEALGLDSSERAALEQAAERAAAVPRTQAQASAPAPNSALSPLVGRVAEQTLLSQHLAGEGPPLLLLLGEPGIGKTRLLQEAAFLGKAQGWSVLEGGCHRQSAQEPYAPLLEALERCLAQVPPAAQRAQLQGCDWLIRVLPNLAEGMGLALPSWTIPPAQERRLLFAAVRRFLDQVAGPVGTLLVLDDLHWAGADALDLLASLLRAEVRHPLRIIGTYRSTEVQAADLLSHQVADLAREGSVQRMELGPLAPGEATALLQFLLQGSQIEGQHPLVETILQRTGGVPYFLVSCAQGLRSGAMDGGTREAIPWVVAETIRQRIGALSEAAQYLLGAVAVAGNEARRPLLLTLIAQLEWGKREVLTALEQACQARLLVEAGADTYRFAHDLIREVVTDDLSATRRAILHQQVAEMLEQRPGEPPIEQLAYHYSRAGNVEQAIRYLEQAGDRAWGLHANTAAEGYYQELLEYLERLGRPLETARVGEKLGKVLVTLARYQKALDVLERAVERYQRVVDLEGQRRTLAALAHPYALLGKPQDGIARLLPLVEASGDQEPTPGLVLLQAALAWLFYQTHQLQYHLLMAEHAVAQARELQNATVLVQAQHAYGLALLELERVDEALPVLEAQVQLAETVGELGTLCSDLTNLSIAYLCRGDCAHSRLQSARAVEVAEHLGDPALLVESLTFLSNTSYQAGDWGQARCDLERAVQVGRHLDTPTVVGFPLLALGRLALAQGQWEEAAQYLEEARTCGERGTPALLAERELLEGRPEAARVLLTPLLDLPDEEHLPWHLLAWAALELGQEVEAEAWLAESLRRATQRHDFDWWLNPHLVEALLRSRQKRYVEAEAALEQALAALWPIPATYHEAKALYFYGLLHVHKGEPTQAREQLEAALASLQKLGEHLYAEPIQQALEQLPPPEEQVSLE